MNEFAAAVVEQQVSLSAETVRREHLKHEASVKSVGVLYCIGGILGTIMGVAMIFRNTSMIFNSQPNQEIVASVVQMMMGLVVAAISVFQFIVGLGVRKLGKWVRIPAIILSSIGLAAFPLGTLINAYIIYLMACKKGGVVLSEEYKAVIQATPGIHYKTSIIVWIFLGLLLALLTFGLMAALLSK